MTVIMSPKASDQPSGSIISGGIRRREGSNLEKEPSCHHRWDAKGSQEPEESLVWWDMNNRRAGPLAELDLLTCAKEGEYQEPKHLKKKRHDGLLATRLPACNRAYSSSRSAVVITSESSSSRAPGSGGLSTTQPLMVSRMTTSLGSSSLCSRCLGRKKSGGGCLLSQAGTSIGHVLL